MSCRFGHRLFKTTDEPMLSFGSTRSSQVPSLVGHVHAYQTNSARSALSAALMK
jgi:hypothetical protein